MYQSGDIIPDQCIASGNDEKNAHRKTTTIPGGE